jgi:hypothetical protein
MLSVITAVVLPDVQRGTLVSGIPRVCGALDQATGAEVIAGMCILDTGLRTADVPAACIICTVPFGEAGGARYFCIIASIAVTVTIFC